MVSAQLFESSSFRFYLRKEKNEMEREREQLTQETNIMKGRKFFLQIREEKSVVDREEDIRVST